MWFKSVNKICLKATHHVLKVVSLTYVKISSMRSYHVTVLELEFYHCKSPRYFEKYTRLLKGNKSGVSNSLILF